MSEKCVHNWYSRIVGFASSEFFCLICGKKLTITRMEEHATELEARIAELEALVDELVTIGDNLFDSLNPIAWKHEWLDKWWKLSSCRRGEREE